MKKYIKQVVGIMMICLLWMNNSIVLAQETFDRTLFDEIIQANQSQNYIQTEGSGQLSIEEDDLRVDYGKLLFNVRLNVPEAQGQVEGELVTPFLSGATIQGHFFLEGDTLIVGVTMDETETEWSTQEVSGEDLQQVILMSVDFANRYGDSLYQIWNELMDFSQTDTEYVLSLKKDLDAESVWGVFEDTGILDEMKKEINRVTEQSGETLSQEDYQLLDRIFSPDVLAILLKENPEMQVSYDKQTKKVTHVYYYIPLRVAELVTYIGEESVSELPEKVLITVDMNIAHQETPYEIQVPQEAIEAISMQGGSEN